MSDTDLIPVSTFSTEALPAAEQFAAWRDSNAVMYDVLPLDEPAPAAFPAWAQAYQLGPILIGETRFPAQRFVRDRQRTDRQMLEVFLIRLTLTGGFTGVADRKSVHARPGDIDITDMGQPIDYRAEPSSMIVMGIPRPAMEAALPDVRALHGLVLSGDRALTGLLADYMRALVARLPHMTRAEANSVANAAIEMAAACLRPAYDHMTATPARSRDATLQKIRQHIEENLTGDDLTAPALAERFGLSRASLYRLFSPLGGVQKYIRDRRLVASFRALTSPAQAYRSIGEIAFRWGFVSDSHFTRVFREAFGCTPGQVRSLGQVTAARPESPPRLQPEYSDWLRRLAAYDE